MDTKLKTLNPDSVRSTWPLDRTQWGLSHRIIHLFNAYPVAPGTQPPVHSKAEKVPYFVEWQGHLWILLHASVPLAAHQAWLSLSGARALHPAAVFALYFACFSWAVVRQVKGAAKLGQRIGFLDGDAHARDGIPDVGVGRVVAALWKTTGSRIAMAVYLAYDARGPSSSPFAVMADVRWWAWLWLQIGLYGIILDFWFYVYHRAMHDVGGLWRFHRTHHLTKHPNSLLAAYADTEQEFFDMVGVPLATWLTFRALGMPLGFFEWWVCHQYIAFTEVLGHSGLRAYGTPPSTLTWALRLAGAELAIEDHDLHHRTGWRSSHNYGKQTKLWDRIFGTGIDRIESRPDNVDWDRGLYFPIW